MKHIVKHIHFVGIGGVGMSGIAEVLVNLGYQVSGSICRATRSRIALPRSARIAIGHAAENIEGANAVVVSTGAQRQPRSAGRASSPHSIVPRAGCSRELMRLKQGIAIAGTHGNTTTSLVRRAGRGRLDPTFVIGGRWISAGANAQLHG
jgi:UDP-N-acetylmuramate--alanine ligase